MITISKNLFLTNKKGFPVLSKAHQRIVKKFMTYKVKIALRGSHPKDNLEDYHKYLCYIFKGHAVFKSEEERTDVQYQNFLQQPLQPLMNNLSAGTYEVFENDTIKYVRYEQAIRAALIDLRSEGKFRNEINFQGPPDEMTQNEFYQDLQTRSEHMLKLYEDSLLNNARNYAYDRKFYFH